jgi:hypothetical protein
MPERQSGDTKGRSMLEDSGKLGRRCKPILSRERIEARARSTKKERQEEQQPREFEIEWDRYMGRD